MTTSVLQFIKTNHNLLQGQQVRIVDRGNNSDYYNAADSSTATELFTKKFYCRVENSSVVSLFYDAALSIPLVPRSDFVTAGVNLVPLDITSSQVTYVYLSSLGVTFRCTWINNINTAITTTNEVTWIDGRGFTVPTWISSI